MISATFAGPSVAEPRSTATKIGIRLAVDRGRLEGMNNNAAILRAVAELSVNGDRPTSEAVFARAGLPHTDDVAIQDMISPLITSKQLCGYRVGHDFGWPQLWLPSVR